MKTWIICYLGTLVLLASITGYAAVSATCALARSGDQEFDDPSRRDTRLIDGKVSIGERVRLFLTHFAAAIATPRISLYAAIGGSVVWGITKLF